MGKRRRGLLVLATVAVFALVAAACGGGGDNSGGGRHVIVAVSPLRAAPAPPPPPPAKTRTKDGKPGKRPAKLIAWPLTNGYTVILASLPLKDGGAPARKRAVIGAPAARPGGARRRRARRLDSVGVSSRSMDRRGREMFGVMTPWAVSIRRRWGVDERV